MATPSSLGALGHAVSAVLPYSTSTARLFVRTSDTGTVAFTGRQVDLGRALHVNTTGGKPLDVTVHRRAGGPPVWRSAKVSVPLELSFGSSGANLFVTVAHQHRSATAGAGSTYETLKSDVFRFKMGTDTDSVFHTGVQSSVNLQAVKRYYRANLTLAFRLASSTAAKDTTTGTNVVCNSPVIELSGVEIPPSVPYKVS